MNKYKRQFEKLKDAVVSEKDVAPILSELYTIKLSNHTSEELDELEYKTETQIYLEEMAKYAVENMDKRPLEEKAKEMVNVWKEKPLDAEDFKKQLGIND